jgi:hypothetical protein
MIEMHIKKKFRGTSAETKPTTGVNIGDEWVNTDTGETFVWTGTEWKATTPTPPLFGLASFYVDDVLIGDEGITGSTKIKSGSITNDRIASGTITGDRIAPATITGDRIASGTIIGDKIAPATITGDRIAPATITRDRLEKNLLVGTVTIDLPTIYVGATTNVDVTVPGLTTSHRVIVMCQSDLEHGLIPIAAYVPAANTLRIRITNFTSAAIDGAARTWFYIAWIP